MHFRSERKIQFRFLCFKKKHWKQNTLNLCFSKIKENLRKTKNRWPLFNEYIKKCKFVGEIHFLAKQKKNKRDASKFIKCSLRFHDFDCENLHENPLWLNSIFSALSLHTFECLSVRIINKLFACCSVHLLNFPISKHTNGWKTSEIYIRNAFANPKIKSRKSVKNYIQKSSRSSKQLPNRCIVLSCTVFRKNEWMKQGEKKGTTEKTLACAPKKMKNKVNKRTSDCLKCMEKTFYISRALAHNKRK